MAALAMEGGGPCQVLLSLPASTQCELAQSFDVNPVREYLERYGVVGDGWLEGGEAARNSCLSLAAQWADLDPTARALLLNALRQSGQYLLASLLDDGARILPSPVKDHSGDLNSSRRRGEVKIQLTVLAARPVASPESVQVVDSSHSNGVSADTTDGGKTVKKRKRRCCLLACFGRGSSTNKTKRKKDQEFVSLKIISGLDSTDGIKVKDSADGMKVKDSDEEDLPEVRVCAMICDRSLEIHTRLLQYLEQKRGVLVLSMNVTGVRGDSVCVNVICMRQSQVTLLAADCASGRLTSDLVTCLQLADIAGDLQLAVAVDTTEVDQAERELAASP